MSANIYFAKMNQWQNAKWVAEQYFRGKEGIKFMILCSFKINETINYI